MKSLEKNKGILLAIILFVAMIFMYNTFLKQDSVPATEELSASAVGSDLVNLFNTIQAVSLSTDLFSSPAYRGLTDFSTQIPQQPVGRNNPFDPIGR